MIDRVHDGDDSAKKCCGQRESAMALLDGIIERQEKELRELKAFKEMLPDPLPNAAEHLIWKWLSNTRANPW